MTNYDRWKLATPDYLEDTDEVSRVHDTDTDVESGYDLRGGIQLADSDEKKRAG
jgi:hypothetical protein